MATIHIEAKKEDIAKIVLTSGDPKRCEYIATNYLENVRLVNTVRGMTAYTGTYQGKEITVFPSGMGMPSMGIYCYELYHFYDVDTIIRLGTCGTTNPDLNVLDTVLLDASYTEGNFALVANRDDKTHLAYANNELNDIIKKTASEANISCKIGTGLCNEFFDGYLSEEKFQDMLHKIPEDIHISVLEMEAFALFYLLKN